MTEYREFGTRIQRGRALLRLPDQTGKVALITGGTDGVGRAVAEQLAGTGATTLLTARTEAKGARVADEIRSSTGRDDIHVIGLDLADLASVDAAAERVLDEWDRLDLLITNAGVGGPKERRETVQGIEYTLGVNHVGHAALVDRLLERITASAPSRIVIVASEAHGRSGGGLDFTDLMLRRNYRRGLAYGRSKLANMYHARELARRLRDTGVTVAAVHPGGVDTPMMRENFRGPISRRLYPAFRRYFLTPQDAAAALLTVALDPALVETTGHYYEIGIAKQPKPVALDDDAARRLWDETQRLIAR